MGRMGEDGAPGAGAPGASDLGRLLRRAHRYWFEDGISEILTGVLFLALGAYLHLLRAVTVGGAARFLLEAGFPLGILVGAALARSLTMRIKRRLTFPRTGQVTYREPRPVHRLLSAATGAGVAMAIVWGSATLSRRQGLPPEAWAPLFAGLLVGVAYLFLGHRVGLWRFYVIGMLSALYGALAATSAPAAVAGIALYFLALGATVALGGLGALLAYLWRTRSLAEAGRVE